jgi:hypothetical protein
VGASWLSPTDRARLRALGRLAQLSSERSGTLKNCRATPGKMVSGSGKDRTFYPPCGARVKNTCLVLLFMVVAREGGREGGRERERARAREAGSRQHQLINGLDCFTRRLEPFNTTTASLAQTVFDDLNSARTGPETQPSQTVPERLRPVAWPGLALLALVNMALSLSPRRLYMPTHLTPPATSN